MPSTKASPGRGGETLTEEDAADLSDPQRRPPQEGEASSTADVQAVLDGPQRRPPQEGEASPGLLAGHPGSAALNEGLPRKGRRDQLRRPLEHLRAPSTKASPGRGGERAVRAPRTPRTPLNEGLPRKGRRAARVRLDGEISHAPQRRPPQEGEASASPAANCIPEFDPRRRPPQEGEASADGGRVALHPLALNEGLPRKGRRGRHA